MCRANIPNNFEIKVDIAYQSKIRKNYEQEFIREEVKKLRSEKLDEDMKNEYICLEFEIGYLLGNIHVDHV